MAQQRFLVKIYASQNWTTCPKLYLMNSLIVQTQNPEIHVFLDFFLDILRVNFSRLNS